MMFPSRRKAAARLAAATIVLVAASAAPAVARDLIESKESLYNNIYVFREGAYVSMTFGYNRDIYTESVYNTADALDLPVAYTRYMTETLAYAGKVKSILEIGFGGGRTAWYLHRSLPGVSVTSVELDPGVIELARKYFGIQDEPGFQLVNKDGRLFLNGTSERYDIILIDAYRGPFVPFHLLTREFYELAKSRLAEGGVIAQNVEPTTMLFDAAVKTINAVFPNIDFYRADGNVVTVAYDGPARDKGALGLLAAERQAALHPRYDLTRMLADRLPLTSGGAAELDPNAKILTDDFAPVESLKAIEKHNRKWPNQ